MPSRRTFLQSMLMTFGAMTFPDSFGATQCETQFLGVSIFNRILSSATAHNWGKLPIGQLMGHIAGELKGTVYAEKTLELSRDREIGSVNLEALDCMTFVENTLGFARMLKKGGRTPVDLIAEVSFMRYRNGLPVDYASRLHYMTDWLVDNQSKHVLKLLSDLPGAVAFTKKVGFMSTHPELYAQLAAHPELIAKIKAQEEIINSRQLKFVPLDKIADVEHLLQTGDIVGVCADNPGLDIVHDGLIIRGADGRAHFMDASSLKANRKVVLEPGSLRQALSWSKHLTGAMFARPLEPAITAG